MKKKISISIEEDTIIDVQKVVGTGNFRNNSHFIELAVNKLLKEVVENGTPKQI